MCIVFHYLLHKTTPLRVSLSSSVKTDAKMCLTFHSSRFSRSPSTKFPWLSINGPTVDSCLRSNIVKRFRVILDVFGNLPLSKSFFASLTALLALFACFLYSSASLGLCDSRHFCSRSVVDVRARATA